MSLETFKFRPKLEKKYVLETDFDLVFLQTPY